MFKNWYYSYYNIPFISFNIPLTTFLYVRLKVSSSDKEFIKSRLKNSAFLLYKDTGKTLEKNLPKTKILKTKNIIVQKLNKGNRVAILNRNDYICKMNNVLHDRSNLQKVFIDHGKILNHLSDLEKKKNRCS